MLKCIETASEILFETICSVSTIFRKTIATIITFSSHIGRTIYQTFTNLATIIVTTILSSVQLISFRGLEQTLIFKTAPTILTSLERTFSQALAFITHVAIVTVSALERSVGAIVQFASSLSSLVLQNISCYAIMVINATVGRFIALTRDFFANIVFKTIARTGFQIYESIVNAIIYFVTQIGKLGGIVTTKGFVMGVMLAFGSIFLIATVIFVFMRKVIG